MDSKCGKRFYGIVFVYAHEENQNIFFSFVKMADYNRIIKSACGLFIKRGCKAVTMDEIASENAVSKRTLYEMFKDKSDLLEQCLLAFHKQCVEQMRDMRNTSANTAELILRFVNRPEEDSEFAEFHKTLLMDVKRSFPELFDKVVRNINLGIFDEMVDMLEEGQRTGYILTDVADVRNMASYILEVMITVRNTQNIYIENKVPDRQIGRHSDKLLFFMRGLCTKKGTDIIDKYLNSRK